MRLAPLLLACGSVPILYFWIWGDLQRPYFVTVTAFLLLCGSAGVAELASRWVHARQVRPTERPFDLRRLYTRPREEVRPLAISAIETVGGTTLWSETVPSSDVQFSLPQGQLEGRGPVRMRMEFTDMPNGWCEVRVCAPDGGDPLPVKGLLSALDRALWGCDAAQMPAVKADSIEPGYEG